MWLLILSIVQERADAVHPGSGMPDMPELEILAGVVLLRTPVRNLAISAAPGEHNQ
jgi:hypothetical protein